MSRQYLAHYFPLARDDEALVVEREAVSLAKKLGNIGVTQEELIEPGDLGQDLQVGEVLRLKELLGAIGRIAGSPEAFP